MSLLGALDGLVLLLHLVACAILVGIVLVQGGRGASLSASFGGGSTSAFGARTDEVMIKATTWAAVGFVITSVALTFLAQKAGSLSQAAAESEVVTVPGSEIQRDIDVTPIEEGEGGEAEGGEEAPAE